MDMTTMVLEGMTLVPYNYRHVSEVWVFFWENDHSSYLLHVDYLPLSKEINCGDRKELHSIT